MSAPEASPTSRDPDEGTLAAPEMRAGVGEGGEAVDLGTPSTPEKPEMDAGFGAAGSKGADEEVPVAPPPPGPPDGGFEAWFRIAGSFVMHFVVLGAVYSWGIFQRFYLANNTFPGTTNTQLALVGGLATFCAFISGPLTGALAGKLGNRLTPAIGSLVFAASYIGASFAHQYWTVALCQGVIFGFASMLTWIPAVSMPSQYFVSKRGLAMGISVSGAGVGGLCLGPLTQLMLDTIGLAWTLRVWGLAGGTMCMLCAATLKARVEPPGMWDVGAWRLRRERWSPGHGRPSAKPAGPPPKKAPFIDVAPFRNMRFNILFLACFFVLWALNTPFAFLPQYATSVIGVSPATASVMLGVANGCSSAGRIGLGALSDRLGALNVMTGVCFLACACVLCFWLPGRSGTVALTFVYSVSYGFFAGSLLSMIPTVLAAIVGIENFAGKMGLLYLSFAPGGLASPPLAGLSLDKTGTYLAMQLLVASAWVAAGTTAALLRVVLGREAERAGKEGKKLGGKVRVM
ncbi:major facilitator superfamily domain-containing protein [Hyaloraphidium curvatum]|nr:major facilitator superfamily domain-containing protein [Hyaloraphidium curvatum]